MNITTANGRPKTRKGFSAIPFFGDLVAMTRLVRDRDAGWVLKLTMLAAMAYVVCPVDALPEGLVPAIGWLDDVGLVLILRLALAKKLDLYRYPIFEKAPPRALDRRGELASQDEIEVREVSGRAVPAQG